MEFGGEEMWVQLACLVVLTTHTHHSSQVHLYNWIGQAVSHNSPTCSHNVFTW